MLFDLLSDFARKAFVSTQKRAGGAKVRLAAAGRGGLS